MRTSLNDAEAKSNSSVTHIVMIGILPTLSDRQLDELFSAVYGLQESDLPRLLLENRCCQPELNVVYMSANSAFHYGALHNMSE